ncbi:hypothetical protein V8C40DRAFT_234297 [Trichoderma camerunense]
MFPSPKIVKGLLFFLEWYCTYIKRGTCVDAGRGMLFTPITNVRAYNLFGISKTEQKRQSVCCIVIFSDNILHYATQCWYCVIVNPL